MSHLIVTHSEAISAGDIALAAGSIYPKDVMAQMYSTALERVQETVYRDHLTPTGAIVVRITVEQWCEGGP